MKKIISATSKDKLNNKSGVNVHDRSEHKSLSIYVYWFIILFFIAATFYILGRSHNFKHSLNNGSLITEEMLLQSNDYLEAGRAKLREGNIDEAITDLTAAIEAGGVPNLAYVIRGEAYMQAGDYKKAMTDFNTVIDKDKNNATAYYDRALLNVRIENNTEALNDINLALSAYVIRPSDTVSLRDLYAKRGQLNLWNKNWEGAIIDYTNSLARPDGNVNPAVYAERAEAFIAMGEYNSAINDYKTGIRVIAEQIQAVTSQEKRESLSTDAMSYFEKSAALNLKMNNKEAALSDLELGLKIANSLKNEENITRIEGLINSLKAELQQNTESQEIQPEVVETGTANNSEEMPAQPATEVIQSENSVVTTSDETTVVE